MKNYSKWKDEEVKNLFKEVEKIKRENKSLLVAFKNYAKKSNRKPNSVRNYYYQEVSSLRDDSSRVKKLGINIVEHEICQAEKFSNKEAEDLVLEILRLKCMGLSVRKACLKLANNSINEMVRYQNKFRTTIKNNKKLYDNCMQRLKIEGLSSKKEKAKENVIYMKRPGERKLTDSDINSLFLGLIKLVKKSAAEGLEQGLVSEAQFANETLQKTLVKLKRSEQMIEQIMEENSKLKAIQNKVKEENLSLKTRIAQLMSNKILKNTNNKNRSLAEYLKEMRQKGKDIKTKIKDIN